MVQEMKSYLFLNSFRHLRHYRREKVAIEPHTEINAIEYRPVPLLSWDKYPFLLLTFEAEKPKIPY